MNYGLLLLKVYEGVEKISISSVDVNGKKVKFDIGVKFDNGYPMFYLIEPKIWTDFQVEWTIPFKGGKILHQMRPSDTTHGVDAQILEIE